MRLSVQLVALWLILLSVLPSLGVAAPYQLKFRSSYTLPQAIINDIKIMELSGLAWDEDEQILYAISDRGGRLFHLKLQLTGNEIHQKARIREEDKHDIVYDAKDDFPF